MSRSLPATRRKTSWRYIAGFLVCALMLSGTTAHPLALEVREKVFWCAWIFGMVVGVFLFGWLRERTDSRPRMPSDRIGAAWRYVGLSVVWGTGIGVVTFSGLVIANGIFGHSEPYFVEGVIVAKDQHSAKNGAVTYTVKVRAEQTRELFEYGVSAEEYARVSRGTDRPLVLRRGFLGWSIWVK